jgi:hypothetical protein
VEIGRFLSSRTFNIVLPTKPVDPTIAMFKLIISYAAKKKRERNLVLI